MGMVWTTNGSRSPLCVLPAAARPRPANARETVVLVLTQTDLSAASTDLQLRPTFGLDSAELKSHYTIAFSSGAPAFLSGSEPQTFASTRPKSGIGLSLPQDLAPKIRLFLKHLV